MILNWTTEEGLDRMVRQGWTIESREERASEGRVLVSLIHPSKTIGQGCDRYQTAVQTCRSLPLRNVTEGQLSLFEVT